MQAQQPHKQSQKQLVDVAAQQLHQSGEHKQQQGVEHAQAQGGCLTG